MSDRPIECSQCKKDISVLYKELENNLMDVTHMCADCPILKKRLHGESPTEPGVKWATGKQGLYCSNCNTSIEACGSGHALGCHECYTVFEQLIYDTLKGEDLIPEKLKASLTKNHNHPLHIGTSPHHGTDYLISSQMNDLNLALDEALRKENYEQAAALRDQIKHLRDRVNDST